MRLQVMLADELPIGFEGNLALTTFWGTADARNHFPRKSTSPNVGDLPPRCDGSGRVSCVCRIILGRVSDGVLQEVSHSKPFWDIEDARNPFQTKCVPERDWSPFAVRRVRADLLCGSFSGHGLIILGPRGFNFFVHVRWKEFHCVFQL